MPALEGGLVGDAAHSTGTLWRMSLMKETQVASGATIHSCKYWTNRYIANSLVIVRSSRNFYGCIVLTSNFTKSELYK